MKSSVPSAATVFAVSLIMAFGGIAFIKAVYAPAEEARVATVTTLSSSQNPVGTADAFTLTASVRMHGEPVRVGSIRFYDETNRWLLGVADASSPTISVTGLSPGRRVIRAEYSGLFRHGANITRASVSPPLTQTVLLTPQVLLSIGPNAGGDQRLITIEATVNARSAHPQGSVTFSASGQLLATRMLDRSGKASFVTSALEGGSHLLSANYSGDDAVAAASASLHVTRGDRADRQALR